VKKLCRGSSVVERSPESSGLSAERRIEKLGEIGESESQSRAKTERAKVFREA